MYYLVDMYDGKLNFVENIEETVCREILDASDSVKETLEFYALGKGFCDAWDQLILWSNTANRDGNYMMRNLHTAEHLVRGFLFEFRTCLDHIETDIKRKYGEDSELWNIFKTGTGNAYDNFPEYAFTYHLRNCSQHCKNIVHGFIGNTGIGISSNVSLLLNDYKKWNAVDKQFMESSGPVLDLLAIFTVTFTAFNNSLKPVIQYLLNTNNTAQKLLYLRKWGDSLCKEFKHDVHCYHIANIISCDGQVIPMENMSQDNVSVRIYPIDWSFIYELTDSIVEKGE